MAAYWCCVAATRALKRETEAAWTVAVFQVIPVGRSLDKEGLPQLVCAAAWDYVDTIVVRPLSASPFLREGNTQSVSVGYAAVSRYLP